METKEKTTLKLGGLPWWQALIAIVLCAIPMYMSNIYETVTGNPAAEYYAFAIIILTIANIQQQF